MQLVAVIILILASIGTCFFILWRWCDEYLVNFKLKVDEIIAEMRDTDENTRPQA